MAPRTALPAEASEVVDATGEEATVADVAGVVAYQATAEAVGLAADPPA